jgi:hypothetical protein
MAKYRGGCLCNNIRYEFDELADPEWQFTCHCRDCQQVTGTGHACSMGTPEAGVTITGDLKIYQIQHKRSVVDSAFCGNCGSPIYKSSTAPPLSGTLFFHMGSLDPEYGDTWLPSRAVFTYRSRPWDTLDHVE